VHKSTFAYHPVDEDNVQNLEANTDTDLVVIDGRSGTQPGAGKSDEEFANVSVP
jgi:hypothetical protein